MKIFGYISHLNQPELLLKGDSSLLVNRKPFFLPEDGTRMAVYPCLVVRISRLGKNISPRFARRYMDGFACGLHIEDYDLKQQLMKEGRPWAKAIAMDGSMPVGNMLPIDEVATIPSDIRFRLGNEERILGDTILSVEQAIADASQTLTIRQGDLLFLTDHVSPWFPKEDDYICASIEGKENLYCKIK